MRPLYRVEAIPVHSVLLMTSREQAVHYPRRDLELSFCEHCGFAANAIFDPTVHNYSPQYEETQGFSETFGAFARSLAQRWVDRYGLQKKIVLEIGCGKGEFLQLLCELGDNQGIGIDPAFVPERMAGAAGGRIQFIQDFYGEKYSHLTADFICCRHTLEHIAPTFDFLQDLRRTIGENRQTLVCFELPDVYRVLKEGAFWDIYYEHCSYFTAGSLARLFRATGFEILDLELDYDDQYILLTARPSGEPARRQLPLEDDLQNVTLAADQFPNIVQECIQYWKSRLRQFRDRSRRAVIWGGGSKGVAFLTTLGVSNEVQYVVDINPYKHGKFMPGTGHEVISPARLRGFRPDEVIVMNPIYVPEIRRQLQGLGLHPQIEAVGIDSEIFPSP